jgi:hypothetical protein
MPNPTASVHDLLDWSEWPSHEQAQRLKAHIDAAASAIVRVHTTPPLPPITVRMATESTRSGGYVPEREADENGLPVTRHINISSRGLSPRLTFLHEWGHYIDNWLGSFDDYASTAGGLLPILGQIEATGALNALRAIEASRSSSFYDRIETLRLLVPQELWARAYAQYVVLRSDDPVMKDEIVLRRSDEREPLPHLEYWDWPDFERIAREIDVFMQRKGWQL